MGMERGGGSKKNIGGRGLGMRQSLPANWMTTGCGGRMKWEIWGWKGVRKYGYYRVWNRVR